MNKRNIVCWTWILGAGLLMAFAQQTDFAARLQQKLSLYYERHVPSKIHLTFNLPQYSPGDTAYYKIHFFTADHLAPVGGRQIVNVRLADSTGEIFHEAKVLLTNGSGFNQIPLPADLAPGEYAVVAFSDAMRDDDPSLCFQRPLRVAGPTVMETMNAKPQISFYPEGGNLITGITNKVVVAGPPNASGKIFSQEGNQVATYGLNQNGFGVFFITPEKNKRYTAHDTDASAVMLPEPQTEGIGILVTVPGNRLPIRVTVQVPEGSALRSQKFILAMTSHGMVYYSAVILFDDKNFITFSLPQENLREGIATITVFDEGGAPRAERLVYIKDSSPAEAEILLPKERFLTRESIPVELRLPNVRGVAVGSSLAVTVFHDNDPASPFHAGRTLVDNVYLKGDLPGTLNYPGDLLNYDPASLDHFMLTRKWRRFSWQDVWEEKMPQSPFRKYLHLEGTARSVDGQMLPDSTSITFFLQRSVMTYVVNVDASGQFDFSLLMDFYGDEEIYYLAEYNGKILPDVEVILNPDFTVPVKSRPTVIQGSRNEFFAQSKKLHSIEQSYTYHLVSRINSLPPSLNSLIEDEVYGVDVTVNLDDYYLFPTMSEILHELIPVLQHRRPQNRDVIKLFFDDRNRFAEGEPLFVIDGVITDNTTYFLSLKPAQVVSIKVIYSIQKLQTFGSIGKNGIVLVETKIPGNAAEVPRSRNVFTARGLDKVSSARYSHSPGRSERIPDLRTNLYWNPDLVTDSSGRVNFSVPASDVTGTFRIVAEGFTPDRKPIFAEEKFEVLFED